MVLGELSPLLFLPYHKHTLIAIYLPAYPPSYLSTQLYSYLPTYLPTHLTIYLSILATEQCILIYCLVREGNRVIISLKYVMYCEKAFE
jgi:hypothetical protein